MSLLKNIEQKISDGEAQLKQHTDLLTQIGNEIERLETNKATTTAVVHQLNGFLVACRDLKKAAEEGKEDVVAAVDAVKEVPAAVVADAANTAA